MKFKTTLILFAVLIALLAVVLIFESKGKRQKTVKEKEDKLIDVAAADIQKISLKREDGTITLKRDDKGEWVVAEPLEARADTYEANSLADSLAGLRLERVVEKEARDLQAYEIPRREVSVWVKGKDVPVKILVGMENPLDNTLFAKREDDPRVVLLASAFKTTLDKKVFDFRDKEVFKFETADVKSLRVAAKDVSWDASLTDQGWFLSSPVKALAVKSRVDNLLYSLSSLRAKEFLAEDKNAEDLKKFGLEKPEYEVSLSLPSANKTVTFAFHKDADKSYAMTSDSNKVVVVEGTVLSDLERKVEELREKKVADFSSWEADKVFVRSGGFSLTAAKEKVKDEDKWFLAAPARDEADRTKVEDFIRKISGLEAAGFVDNPGSLAGHGLEPPAAEVRIWTRDAENKVLETAVLIGTEDAAKKQVALKNPKYDYLFLVDSAFLQDFPKDPQAWKTEPAKAEPAKEEKK